MELKSFTVDEMLAFHPCGWKGENNGINYTRERIAVLWAGRDALNAREMLDLPISVNDRLWAVTRKGVLPVTINSQWTEGFVARAIRRALRMSGQPREWRRWARRWLNGKDRSAKSAVAIAGAVWAKVRAARAAEAAMMAARAAGTTRATERATRAAARATAWGRERGRQIRDLRKLLEEGADD